MNLWPPQRKKYYEFMINIMNKESKKVNIMNKDGNSIHTPGHVPISLPHPHHKSPFSVGIQIPQISSGLYKKIKKIQKREKLYIKKS